MNEKKTQRAARGICPRSGSIKTLEIVLEASDGKQGAVSKHENSSKTQKEAIDAPCTKSLGRCHEVKSSSWGRVCRRTRMLHYGLCFQQGFHVSAAAGPG